MFWVTVLGFLTALTGLGLGYGFAYAVNEHLLTLGNFMLFVNRPIMLLFPLTVAAFLIGAKLKRQVWFWEYVHALRHRICIPVKYVDGNLSQDVA